LFAAIAIRTGDTPQSERARFQREPADILITTPESLYLLLTSNAREALRSVDTIIVDEIHALVPTKRGAHLALSLERLEANCERPPQRIGLSATSVRRKKRPPRAANGKSGLRTGKPKSKPEAEADARSLTPSTKPRSNRRLATSSRRRLHRSTTGRSPSSMQARRRASSSRSRCRSRTWRGSRLLMKSQADRRRSATPGRRSGRQSIRACSS
jgi:hypothetical protein